MVALLEDRSPLLQPRIALGPDRPSHGDIDRVPAKVAIALRWMGGAYWLFDRPNISNFWGFDDFDGVVSLEHYSQEISGYERGSVR
jgi:hypothetical protein